MQAGDFIFAAFASLNFVCYSNQPVSQRVTLLFFFTEKKKRSKKRKEFAFHLYCKIQVSHEDYTRDSHQQNSPSGANRRLVRRNTTPFTLEIGA